MYIYIWLYNIINTNKSWCSDNALGFFDSSNLQPEHDAIAYANKRCKWCKCKSCSDSVCMSSHPKPRWTSLPYERSSPALCCTFLPCAFRDMHRRNPEISWTKFATTLVVEESLCGSLKWCKLAELLPHARPFRTYLGMLRYA